MRYSFCMEGVRCNRHTGLLLLCRITRTEGTEQQVEIEFPPNCLKLLVKKPCNFLSRNRNSNKTQFRNILMKPVVVYSAKRHGVVKTGRLAEVNGYRTVMNNITGKGIQNAKHSDIGCKAENKA